MGHDIYAYKVSEEEKIGLYEAMLEGKKFDSETYDIYRRLVYAGQYRRSAFDPLNRVIYQLLDVDELYGGCSGIGETRTVEIGTLQQALAALDYVGADTLPKADPGFANEVLRILEEVTDDTEAELETGQRELDFNKLDLDEERQFLNDTVSWMLKHNRKNIEIYFG